MSDRTEAEESKSTAVRKGTHEEKSESIRCEIDESSPCNAPAETPLMFEALKDKMRPLYGTYFKTEMDFEYFCMLPIPTSARAQFIRDITTKELLTKQ